MTSKTIEETELRAIFATPISPTIAFNGQHVSETNFETRVPAIASNAERIVREKIRAAAPEHIDLLHIIASTEGAVHEFQSNVARLERLQKELQDQKQLVDAARGDTQKKLTEFTREKDSFGRRWAYILSHKRRVLQQQINDSEHAYLQAISAQSSAEQRQRKLEQDKEVMESQNVVLIVEVEKHGTSHREIDELYQRIFDGPTPGFPDEDEREQIFASKKTAYDASKIALMNLNKSAKDLALIHSTIARAEKEVYQAEYELDAAIFDGSEEARMFLNRCVRLIDQLLGVSRRMNDYLPLPAETRCTRAHQALVRHLGLARTAAQSSCGPLQTITNELGLARDAEVDVLKIVRAHELSAKKAMKDASREMEDARQALHEIRQNAFEITVGHGASAPAYNECCDRATQFENAAHEAVASMSYDPIIDDSGLPPPPSYDAVLTSDRPIGIAL